MATLNYNNTFACALAPSLTCDICNWQLQPTICALEMFTNFITAGERDVAPW